MTADIWRGKRVFLTGHTGFKGSWLALWLADMGADVTGYALPAPTEPSLFVQARIDTVLRHIEGDVRDLASLEAAINSARPDVVFHLAAQSLVRYSYDHPVETYATNVMGTVNLLDACRRSNTVRAVVCVTSDKCYENREWVWPYREIDPMGGYDPYSSSKGAAELVISAYRRSFFDGNKGVASVRAGNVIGGGDWALDRLVPDIVRAIQTGQRPMIRSPRSIRPWQHVLEALGGYLLIAERLLGGDISAATGWNFGPDESDARSVEWIVERILAYWGIYGWDRPEGPQPHEAQVLKLDCSKVRSELGWRPAMTLGEALEKVVEWYRSVGEGTDPLQVSRAQLKDYQAKFRQAISECNI